MKLVSLVVLALLGSLSQACYVLYNGVDLMGGDLSYVAGLTLDACGNLCCATSNCVGFSWAVASPNNHCWLKSSFPSAPGSITNGVITSGVKYSSTMTTYANQDAPGGDYQSRALNYADCQAYCATDPQCQSYTWAASAPNAGIAPYCTVNGPCCYLKSSVPARNPYNGLTTGVKAVGCSLGNTYLNTDYPGGDYNQLVVSQSDCARQCCTDSQCAGFSWMAVTPNPSFATKCPPGGNCCLLKSSMGSPNNNFPNMISSVKSTPPPAPTSPPAPTAKPCTYTYYPSIDFPGGDLRQRIVDAAACNAECCADSQCVGYQWISYPTLNLGACLEGQNCCLLKNAMSSAHAQAYTNMYSYIKN